MNYAPEPFGQKHFGEPAPSVWLVRYWHTWSNKAVSFAYAQPCAGQGLAVVVSQKKHLAGIFLEGAAFAWPWLVGFNRR